VKEIFISSRVLEFLIRFFGVLRNRITFAYLICVTLPQRPDPLCHFD